VKDIIKYTATTSNNKFLIGKQLVKNPDPEAAKKEQGILSFGLFEKVEDIAAPTEEVPEPAAPEGGWPLKWKEPFVKVDECVREPRIKYFRTPKLGGYLAVPWEYNYEVDTMNDGMGPDLVDGECPAFPEYTMTTETMQGCVALDTLGTDGLFKEADSSTAVEWTMKLSQGLGRIAKETIEAKRATRNGYKERNAEQWTDLTAARTAMAEELPAILEGSKAEAAAARAAAMPPLPEAVEGEEAPEAPAPPEEPEAETALREGLAKLKKLKALVEEKKEMVMTVTDRSDEPSRQWTVLQAVMLMLKLDPACCDSWEKCQALASSDEFWAAFSSCDVSVAREVLMVQSAESIKATIAEVNGKDVERTHVPISVLLEWLSVALEVQAAAVEVRKAKKAEAEAAGEAFEEQIEDTVTDKPAEEAPVDE